MLEIKQKNTKKQGDVGLGAAIAWATNEGYSVSIPLTDSQDYDLIIDINGDLYRVQVKTTTFKAKSGFYYCSLSVKGGNRTSVGTVKPFVAKDVDALFVLTPDGSYFIETDELENTHNLTLNIGYDLCKV